MPHSPQKLLLDTSNACEEIMEFTDGKSITEFKKDRIPELLEKVRNY